MGLRTFCRWSDLSQFTRFWGDQSGHKYAVGGPQLILRAGPHPPIVNKHQPSFANIHVACSVLEYLIIYSSSFLTLVIAKIKFEATRFVLLVMEPILCWFFLLRICFEIFAIVNNK